jgi:hypothetical protein
MEKFMGILWDNFMVIFVWREIELSLNTWAVLLVQKIVRQYPGKRCEPTYELKEFVLRLSAKIYSMDINEIGEVMPGNPRSIR